MTTFLLSPADCNGKRAGYLTRPGADSEVARRLRGAEGAPIGEVFSFVSGLYFRGKLAYARRFGATIRVITSDRGLVEPDYAIYLDDLRQFAGSDIGCDVASFLVPLRRDAEALAAEVPGTVVLLGSVATPKYVACLADVLGERLLYPAEFPPLGDMARGSRLLKAARAGVELAYAPVVELPSARRKA